MGWWQALRELHQAWRRKPWRLRKPVVIQFPVNDICNARCRMCLIWQRKLDYQISAQELDQGLRNPLYSEVRAVGINGGEPTLRKDLPELVRVLYARLPKLQSISLITNALVAKKVTAALEATGRAVREHGGHFDVMISLDGVGEVHDTVRGRAGNFAQAERVLQWALDSEWVQAVRLGCTVIRDNVYGLHELLDFALDHDVYIKYRLGIGHPRLYNLAAQDDFSLSASQRAHFCEFLEGLLRYYESHPRQQFFYRSLIDQLRDGAPRRAGCDWQHRGATLSARGELSYCAVASPVLGRIVTADSQELYFGGQQILADIVKQRCADCSHDYEGLPPFRVLLRHYAAAALQRAGVDTDNLLNSAWLRPLVRLRQVQRLRHRRQRLASWAQAPEATSTRAPAKPAALRITVCGWYGTETLGDKAILGGVVLALRAVLPAAEIRLVSLHPWLSELTVQQMPELARVTVCDVHTAYQTMAQTDLLLFGGGPLMAVDELADMLSLFERAAQLGIPRLLAGCGVGPCGGRSHSTMIRRLLALASARIFRDAASQQAAAALAPTAGFEAVAEDPAFTWLQAQNATPLEPPWPADGAPVLVLGLRAWPYEEYARHFSRRRARAVQQVFDGNLIDALTRLQVSAPGLRLCPIPMCTQHYGADDRWYYHAWLRRAPALRAAVDRRFLGREPTPAQAYQAFRAAGGVLTMRFHSLVFALAAGRPCVAVDYTLGQGKVTWLAQRHQVPARAIDRCDADFLYLELQNRLRASAAGPALDAEPGFPQSLRAALDALGLVPAAASARVVKAGLSCRS